MAFDDLDLEFEDEEEAKKKKNDAVQVDVDLEFAVPDNGATKSRPAIVKPVAPSSQGNPVTKIADARAAQTAVKKPVPLGPAAHGNRPVASAPKVVGTSALSEAHYEVEGQEIVQLREQMRRIEFEAEVKVAVAEFKMELLSELLSDTKLMQHQVDQLLLRINAKHPDMKQEVLMIKKILADFIAKKRK